MMKQAYRNEGQILEVVIGFAFQCSVRFFYCWGQLGVTISTQDDR
jgi:hypothetical protein